MFLNLVNLSIKDFMKDETINKIKEIEQLIVEECIVTIGCRKVDETHTIRLSDNGKKRLCELLTPTVSKVEEVEDIKKEFDSRLNSIALSASNHDSIYQEVSDLRSFFVSHLATSQHDRDIAEKAIKGFVQEYSIYLPVSVLDKYLSTKSESNEGEGKI